MGTVVIAGRTIHYHAAGRPQPRTGHRVLYVHGTGCNGMVWGPHMAAIADVHAPVAIDLPGHGLSEGERGATHETDSVLTAITDTIELIGSSG